MNNSFIIVKIKDRCNKKDSSDYENIEPYQFLEAFNKAQDNWVRRQLQGINQTHTGAEESTRRIDDLQVLLVDWVDTWTDKGLYWESNIFPDDYLQYCRISANIQEECKSCPPRKLRAVFEGNEADVDLYLSDENRQPDFNWATTFTTISGNKFRLWTNDTFNILDPVVTYYRNPVHIQIAGQRNPDDGLISVVTIECEFPDSVIEVLCDEAAGIITGDIENWNQRQRLETSVEHNT